MNRSTHSMSLFLVALIPLLAASGAASAGGPPARWVRLTQEENRIVVQIGVGGHEPFTDYYFGPTAEHPYVRPYMYPVLAADGVGVTSDQIDVKGGDHPHHRSLYVAHGNVGGVDHWSLEKQLKGGKQPQQKHLKFEQVKDDTLIEDLQWMDDNEKPMLNERRTLRFFSFGDASRVIDLTSELTPTNGAVKFGDTKEAGLCSVRMSSSISKQATITESTGATAVGADPGGNAKATSKENEKREKAVWGKTADWCDESGLIDGKPYGVAIFDHPSNLNHPTHWHVRLYGLMAANNFGSHMFDKSTPENSGEYTLEAGKTLTFRYEVVVHEGDAKAAHLDEKFKDFAAR